MTEPITISKASALAVGAMALIAVGLLFIGYYQLGAANKEIGRLDALAKRYKYDLAAVGPCHPEPR